jgi:hypothetical protein
MSGPFQFHCIAELVDQLGRFFLRRRFAGGRCVTLMSPRFTPEHSLGKQKTKRLGRLFAKLTPLIFGSRFIDS